MGFRLFVFSFTEVHVACVCVYVLSQLVEKSIVLIDELKRVAPGGRGVTLSIRYEGIGRERETAVQNSTQLDSTNLKFI